MGSVSYVVAAVPPEVISNGPPHVLSDAICKFILFETFNCRPLLTFVKYVTPPIEAKNKPIIKYFFLLLFLPILSSSVYYSNKDFLCYITNDFLYIKYIR